MIYGCIFLLGYLLATMYSGWQRQRFVEAWVNNNRVEFLLRVGLADELDRLYRDVAAVAGPLKSAQSRSQQSDTAFRDIHAQLLVAAQRIENIKVKYGNTRTEDEFLRRFLAERSVQAPRALEPSASQETRAAAPLAPPVAPDKVEESKIATPPPPAAPVEAKKP
jgi:hypothetical protein